MKKFDKVDLFVLLLAALVLFIFWPKPSPKSEHSNTPTLDATGQTTPTDPSKPADPNKPADPAQPVTPAIPPPPKVEEKLVVLKNSVAETTFTTHGGGIKTAKILPARFAGEVDQILNAQGEAAIGSLARGAGQLDKAPWDIVEQTERSITFTTKREGLTLTKKWAMADGAEPEKGPGYLWNLTVTFKNDGTTPYTSDEYYLYTGAAVQFRSTDALYVCSGLAGQGGVKQFKAGSFEKERRLWILWEIQPQRDIIRESLDRLEWAGVANQYYWSLINSTEPKAGQFWTKKFPYSFEYDGSKIKAEVLQAAFGLPAISVAAGQESTFSCQVYNGPRSATVLDRIAKTTDEAMFYNEESFISFFGLSGVLSRLFLGMLNTFKGFAGTYGMAIILLTLVVRIVIWPLYIKSQRSMKRMSLLAPMMNEIREKYKAREQTKENQMKMQQETMALYRTYQVSPLGGCIPILLQMPIFFGYFGMLNHAVEMRGHGFLWAKDLTLPDTVAHLPWWLGGLAVNPLPLIMTATMYLQMKMTPTPAVTDENLKLQMKIFKFMPIFFLLFCYTTGSALALYWTVQNIFGMLQTWVGKFFPEPVLKKREVPQRMAPISGLGGQPKKQKGPKPPRTGGGGSKSAFKNG